MKRGDRKSGEIEIVNENKIFENQYTTIYNDDVVFPSDTKGTYIRVSTETDKSVAVLPITKDGNIILIKTFRHAVRGWGYEAPKGGAMVNENEEEAARRELLEETGIVAKRLVYIGEFSESPAIFCGKMKCYIAFDCRYGEKSDREDTETISGVKEFSASEYLRDFSMDYTDAMTHLLVYKYLELKGI